MMMMTNTIINITIITIINSTGGEAVYKPKSRGTVESVVKLRLATFPTTNFHTPISRFYFKTQRVAGREGG